MPHSLKFYKTGDAICDELLGLLELFANQTLKEKDTFRVGISGGEIAEILAEGLWDLRSDFTKWQIFFCDQPLVPEDHPQSTFKPFKDMLQYHPKIIPESNFYKLNLHLPPTQAAEEYEETIRTAFQVTSHSDIPCFDLIILGIGEDGHTAALFPNHPVLKEKKKWVASIEEAPTSPYHHHHPCVTMTLPLLNASKVCLFGAQGISKAKILKQILIDKDPSLPVSMVVPENGCSIFVACDEAASLIDDDPSSSSQ